MSRILVIGGYGGFGARLCRRLSRAGHELLVAGRDVAKAERFCAELANARPLAVDRNADLGPALARHRPDLVIDAAGPFQGSGYQVPEACIVARIGYLDLADARDFVVGISALDARARAAGVPVVSGASSVPSLTDAVTQVLARGLTHVASVETALSAANRAGSGASVMAAILSYVGRPLRLWRGGRWAGAWGWGELRRAEFRLAGGAGLSGRLVAITDVPDHDLLPPRLPGRPAVTFRAGTEFGFQMLALSLLGGLLRWRLIRSLRPITPLLLGLYRLTERFGGLRSAMSITLVGRDREGFVGRRWTVVAEDGQGLEIPILAATLLADDHAAGRLAPGAAPAVGLVDFDRFEAAWAGLPLRQEFTERRLDSSLYARMLGPAFDRLPPAVRAVHDFRADAGAWGRGQVRRGHGVAARIVAHLVGFPPEGEVPLHVSFAERDGKETWTRDFGGHLFSSELGADGDLIQERFGPLRFGFHIPCGLDGLRMVLRRWSAFHVPLPLALAPRIAAREWEEEGRFRFNVRVAMPFVGEVVRYTGWLQPVPCEKGGPGEPGPPSRRVLAEAD